jgi:hypothetical protein
MPVPSTLGSWPALVARLDAAGRPHWWSAEPALRELTTIQQLQDWTTAGNPQRADAVLGALVRLAAGHGAGDVEATLVVLAPAVARCRPARGPVPASVPRSGGADSR